MLLDLHIGLRDIIYEYLDFKGCRKMIKIIKNDLNMNEILKKLYGSVVHWERHNSCVEHEMNNIDDFFEFLNIRDWVQDRRIFFKNPNLFYNDLDFSTIPISYNCRYLYEDSLLIDFYKLFLIISGELDDNDKFTPMTVKFMMNGDEKTYSTAFCGRCNKLIQNYHNHYTYYNHQISVTHMKKMKLKGDDITLWKIKLRIILYMKSSIFKGCNK